MAWVRARAPPGNKPFSAAELEFEPDCTIGYAPISLIWYSYHKGSTSKNPKPERTEVLPFPNGSQAKPTRGSKFRNVGLRMKGSPRWAVVSAKFTRFESLPCTSVGTVVISYRKPRFSIKFG